MCPECGSASLSEEPLAGTGTIETHSVVHVAGPRFADDTPYATAIADFGPVRLTGVLRGVAADELAIGDAVRPDAEPDGPGDRPLVVFRPA